MGSTLSAYFIRSDDLEAVQQFYPQATAVAGSPWVVCKRGDAAPSEDMLWGSASLTEAVSQRLGETIFVYADSSNDSFVYEHSRNGMILRKLVWFPMLDEEWTPGWLCAQGEPEEWEATFFRPQQLKRVIAEEAASYAERGEVELFPAREAEIRRLWAMKSIVAGSTLPRGDASVALMVAHHFGLQRPKAR